MKDKLTHTLPQIKCSEKTRKAYDSMSIKARRTISNILQIHTEEICKHYELTGEVFVFKINVPEIDL